MALFSKNSRSENILLLNLFSVNIHHLEIILFLDSLKWYAFAFLS